MFAFSLKGKVFYDEGGESVEEEEEEEDEEEHDQSMVWPFI